MTDQQKIERLAEFMGWHKGERPYWFNGFPESPDTFVDFRYGEKGHKSCELFNPLTDWNHWRQMEESVMENLELSHIFIRLLVKDEKQAWGNVRTYMRADLPTRVDALLAALDSIK